MRGRYYSLAAAILIVIGSLGETVAQAPRSAEGDVSAWKAYTNGRFGFSIRPPGDWRLGAPLPDGVGIPLHPPIQKSQLALSGFLNIAEGTSQDGRQTLEEFATFHRKIISDL